ncbi:Protease HtpX [Candidatus Gugararchaeum adminiculabundum]|nr:Protease HtpX [Candidatus Gugararchaeum adminiculabundum]
MPFSSFYDQIESNKRKTYLLFFVFFLVLVSLGFFIGVYLGSVEFGIEITFIFGIFYSLLVYFQGASMLLSLTGAQPATDRKYVFYVDTVEGLAIAAGIPAPKAYVIQDPAPNAFATGRDPKNSYVAVTTGLLDKMSRQELEGVVAHEISHIQNYDIRVSLYAVIMVGLIGIISNIFLRSFLYSGRGSNNRKGEGGGGGFLLIIGIIFMILAPIIAQLIRLAISRQREFLADANGARLTRYPEGLASALEKIGKDPTQLQRADDTTAQLYIASPLKGKMLSGLLSTHPPIEERVKRLRSM